MKNIGNLLKAICAITVAVAVYFFAPDSMLEPARRVLAIFVLAALSWALEMIPLYATSLGVVILLTFLIALPAGVLGLEAKGLNEFYVLFSDPVIMLFLGGFVLAAVFHKFHIDKFIIQKVMRCFGHHPYFFLLGFMTTSAFISMWMSNTATTALMLALLKPILEQIRTEDKFGTALILAVAFGANIGGIGTPIGTPPNAIALGLLENHGVTIHFATWMMMAVPLVIVLLFISSVILYKMFPTSEKRVHFETPQDLVLNYKSKIVLGLALVTIILWVTTPFHKIPESLVALSAVGMIVASGLLDRKDFNNIEWDILVLMWGGLALGKAMELSGLARWIVNMPLFEIQGFALVIVFVVFTFITSTFMSNTAATSILVPLALSVSSENPIYLALVVTLTCGFDMALPVSSPPNAMAFSTGRLKAIDMIKAGASISVLAVIIILAGYKFIFSRVLEMP